MFGKHIEQCPKPDHRCTAQGTEHDLSRNLALTGKKLSADIEICKAMHGDKLPAGMAVRNTPLRICEPSTVPHHRWQSASPTYRNYEMISRFLGLRGEQGARAGTVLQKVDQAAFFAR